MPANVIDLLALSRDITATALLMIAIWGAYKAWWVPGWAYRQALADTDTMRQERDDYRRELFQVVGLANRSVNAAERAATRAEWLATSPLATDRLDAERDVRTSRLQRQDDQQR